MSKKNKKNAAIVVAMIAVLIVGSISAYFTATDSSTNTFTVGSVDVNLTETDWDTPDTGDKFTDDDGDGVPDSQQITPNHEFNKNPQVINEGENDAYVYTMVAVPKKNVRVSLTSGNTAGTNLANTANQDTQLFQLNEKKDAAGSVNKLQIQASQAGKASKSGEGVAQPIVSADSANNAKSWTGVDTFNDTDWFLLKVNPATEGTDLYDYQQHYNVYLFAYAKSTNGNAATLTKLAGKRNGTTGTTTKGSTTPAVFESVTVANMVNINDLMGTNDEDNSDYDSKTEGTMPQILVKSYAIQCDNLTDADTADADAVWSILNNQDGAYKALADELHDMDAANNAWQSPGVDSADRTVN